MTKSETGWYAITVRHQHERRTERVLRLNGWDTLVPLYHTRRQWSDRSQDIEVPLFSGYVFCRFPLAHRIRVEDSPGVARIVQFGGVPAALADSEIAAIRSVLESKLPLGPWPYLKAGDRVRLERGPLKGLEGTLIRAKDRLRLVIGVELLQRAIAVEVDPEMVTPLRAISAGVCRTAG
jgi:transcription antitermination factor NusG